MPVDMAPLFDVDRRFTLVCGTLCFGLADRIESMGADCGAGNE